MALLIQRKAAKELAGVPREEWERLKERLQNIARNPRARHPGVEPLTGRDHEYRVRQGNWRAIYTVTDKGDVEVIHVRHRREVYRTP